MKNLFTISFLTLILASACGTSTPDALESSEAKDSEEANTTESTTLKVNTTDSNIDWMGYKVVGDDHGGSIKLSEGEITLNGADIVSGKFTIDMNSMESSEGLDGLTDHLKNEDFFDVPNHPTVEFETTFIASNPEEEFTHIVEGNLTLLGTTKSINFPANITEENGQYTGQASFTIDRTDWGITYNSGSFFDDLGDKVIKDEISLELNIVTE